MKKFILTSTVLFILITNVFAQKALTRDERMKWWREARFGMFIHWGDYAQWAGLY
ncbi:alpha-L-fucosidase, partial [Mucilaginibacter sp. UYCu711]|uniref:alpha-L-fucosidase n=1 Tax=Mucilaginibacter sp. UYCu711 TaxID=3156339 RepID=UPI003D236D66